MVTSVMGTQMGKTAGYFNVIGAKLDDDPEPIIYVGPTQSNIDNVIEPKIMAMFSESASLGEKLDRSHGVTTKHKKTVAGITLRLAWAGSATEMASDSASLVVVDELDRIDAAATGEGSVETQAEARGDAYSNSVVSYTSTPKRGSVDAFVHPVSGMAHWAVADESRLSSPIWRSWQRGTREEWAVPCPHCGHYFVPRSSLLTWEGKGTERECTPTRAAQTARLICERSGCLIEDRYRQWMNARGAFVAPGQSLSPVAPFPSKDETPGALNGQPDTAGNTHWSFWVSGLCSFSKKKSYGYLAKKLLTAQRSGDPEQMLAVLNTGFGEVYAPPEDVPAWNEVFNLRGRYAAGSVLPGEPLLLATVDVQGNRFVYVVRAWLPGLSSYLVEHGEIWTPPGTTTSQIGAWDVLDELMTRDWHGRSLDELGIDSGYLPDMVQTWAAKHKGRVRVLRGANRRIPTAYKPVKTEINKQGVKRKRGDQYWEFDPNKAKAWVHSRVHWPADRPGFWLLPSDVSEDYCRQIVAEAPDAAGKYHRVTTDNHYLDCEAMSYMLARMHRMDKKTTAPGALAAVSAALGQTPDPEAAPASEPRQKRAGKRFRVRGDGDPSPPPANASADAAAAPRGRSRFRMKR